MSMVTALVGNLMTFKEFGLIFGYSFIGSTVFTYIYNKIVDHYKLANYTIIATAVLQFLLLAGGVVLFIISLIK